MGIQQRVLRWWRGKRGRSVFGPFINNLLGPFNSITTSRPNMTHNPYVGLVGQCGPHPASDHSLLFVFVLTFLPACPAIAAKSATSATSPISGVFKAVPFPLRIEAKPDRIICWCFSSLVLFALRKFDWVGEACRFERLFVVVVN